MDSPKLADPPAHKPGSTCCNAESAVLFAKDLRKTYSGRAVVDGVSITVQPREIVGLLGPNGAGKTTSFYMLVGLLRSDAGQILLDGQPIEKLPIHQRARLGLGSTPTDDAILQALRRA